MGCGASSAVPIVPSDNDPNIINQHNENPNKRYVKSSGHVVAVNVNGCPPKNGIKLSLFSSNNKVGSSESARTMTKIFESIGIQTESDIDGIKTQYTQTDNQLLPEDELELMILQAEQYDDENDNDNQRHFPAYDSEMNLNEEVNKSVMLQTEELHEQKTGKKATMTSLNLKLVTIDVGIQVKKLMLSRATQTRLGAVNPNLKVPKKISHHERNVLLMMKNNHPRISMSMDMANNRILSKTSIKSHAEDIIAEELSFAKGLNANSHDFESQTDPLLSNILAANSAGNELAISQSFTDLSSPFSHIERELLNHHPDITSKLQSISDNKLQDCISKLLDDIDDTFGNNKTHVVSKNDASVQTDNDPLTDEAPEFAARPPPCRKREMIPSINMFREIEKRISATPEAARSSPQELVNYLCRHCTTDLFKVRAIFRWITHNIRYDWKYMGVTMTSDEILQCGEGVCKDYCQLFGDLCQIAGIRVKKIEGFAKGHDYRPGHQFKPGEDITHTWNAVYLLSAWRLIDTTWGTGFTDHSGKFQRKLNEHFFLTDPEVLIWTHFPYNDLENNYSRWQLLDKPITLEEFNSLPKVAPNFFDFNMKIRTKPQNPVVFRISTEIKIGAHEPIRYKYKLYPSDEVENSSLNHYVFCQLKEDRSVGSFMVTPPIEGRYFLKIFAKPEREMQEGQDATSLQNVITFLLECTRARRYIEPYPLNELPWGPTQSFYDYKLRLSQLGPVIVTWGGRRRLVIEANETMLVTYQVFDADAMELDTKNIIIRDDTGNKITFTISPPRIGTFKFMIFGMPKPKQKGKWRLPLLATFLIDCKLIKALQYDEDQPANNYPVPEEPGSSEKKKIRPIIMR